MRLWPSALAIGVEVSGDEEEILGEEPAQVEQVQQGEEHKVDEAAAMLTTRRRLRS